jgi:hypothetical protein
MSIPEQGRGKDKERQDVPPLHSGNAEDTTKY